MTVADTTYFTDTVSYDNSTPYQLVNYFACLKMDEKKRGNYSMEEVSKVIESKTKYSEFDVDFENYIPPSWLPDNCPTFDWVEYKGEKLVAVLDFEASEKRHKPVLDLSYCMTTAVNDTCYIYRGVLWNPKKFKLNPFIEAHK